MGSMEPGGGEGMRVERWQTSSRAISTANTRRVDGRGFRAGSIQLQFYYVKDF